MRTFATELFMGEGSNLTPGKLGFLNEITGQPVRKVVVLPLVK